MSCHYKCDLQCVQPIMTGKTNERKIEEQLPVLRKSLEIIDSHFLKDSKFIVGKLGQYMYNEVQFVPFYR